MQQSASLVALDWAVESATCSGMARRGKDSDGKVSSVLTQDEPTDRTRAKRWRNVAIFSQAEPREGFAPSRWDTHTGPDWCGRTGSPVADVSCLDAGALCRYVVSMELVAGLCWEILETLGGCKKKSHDCNIVLMNSSRNVCVDFVWCRPCIDCLVNPCKFSLVPSRARMRIWTGMHEAEDLELCVHGILESWIVCAWSLDLWVVWVGAFVRPVVHHTCVVSMRIFYASDFDFAFCLTLVYDFFRHWTAFDTLFLIFRVQLRSLISLFFLCISIVGFDDNSESFLLCIWVWVWFGFDVNSELDFVLFSTCVASTFDFAVLVHAFETSVILFGSYRHVSISN